MILLYFVFHFKFVKTDILNNKMIFLYEIKNVLLFLFMYLNLSFISEMNNLKSVAGMVVR